MSFFNINFDQFKPSTTKVTIPTPAITPNQNSVTAPIIKPPQVSTPQIQSPALQDQSNGKLFGGSLMSKAFDLLRLPEFAIASFDKGILNDKARAKQQGTVSDFLSKTKAGLQNILPGIQNKTSFGTAPNDVNIARDAFGLQNPIAQNIVNTEQSFSAPTLPLGKIASLLGKGVKFLPGVTKTAEAVGNVGSKVVDFAKKTPVLYKPIETVSPYFRNPELGKMVENTQQTTQTRLQQLYNLLKTSTEGLSPAEQARIGQVLEGSITSNDKYAKIAEPIKKLTDQIGQESVKMGLLDPASYEKFKGTYLSHIFTDALDQGNNTVGAVKSNFPKIIGNFFKHRQGAEGYVKQFAPAVFKGLGTEIKDIQTAKLYKDIAGKFGVAAPAVKEGRKIVDRVIPQGFTYAPDAITSTKVGKIFKDLAIPQNVADYVSKLRNVPQQTVFDKALNIWKAGKTIWNPAYHMRNVLSNQILSDMSTGRGLIRTAVDYVGSVRSYFGKGNQKFVTAAENAGIIKNKNFGAALNEFLDAAGLAQKSKFQEVGNFAHNVQQVTEETSKLNVFKSWVEKIASDTKRSVDAVLADPMAIKTAADEAQKAIFSPYKISQGERGLVKNLIPFYSFTRQAVPFTAKTYVNNPGRLAKYPKLFDAIQNLSKDTSGVSPDQLPAQYQNQVRLPFKDKQGRQTYFDPSYILPFGNFQEGGTRGQLPFGLGINPFAAEAMAQTGNFDPFFQRPVTTSNIPGRSFMERISHLFTTLAPTIATNIKNKLVPAVSGQPDYAGRFRNPLQVAVDALGGIKTSQVNPGDLRSKSATEQVLKLRSIQNEEQQILQDQSTSDAEKRSLLEKLRGVYQDYQQSIQP